MPLIGSKNSSISSFIIPFDIPNSLTQLAHSRLFTECPCYTLQRLSHPRQPRLNGNELLFQRLALSRVPSFTQFAKTLVCSLELRTIMLLDHCLRLSASHVILYVVDISAPVLRRASITFTGLIYTRSAVRQNSAIVRRQNCSRGRLLLTLFGRLLFSHHLPSHSIDGRHIVAILGQRSPQLGTASIERSPKVGS